MGGGIYVILATYKHIKRTLLFGAIRGFFVTFALGDWVSDQRQNKKRKAKVLSQERIKRLENLGLYWDALIRMGHNVRTACENLKRYIIMHLTSTSSSDKTDGGIYVRKFRSQFFKNWAFGAIR